MFLEYIPIVSLDKIYLECDESNIIFLDCTRIEGEETIVSRNNPDVAVNVQSQIADISTKLKASGQKQIVLADDVVFSGSVLRNVINQFKGNNIEVIGIRSCISTVDSYDYFNDKLPLGLACGYLLGKDTIDQICERDFYYGIAQSGISVRNSSGKIYKAPYFKPYGNPVERASIPPEYESIFSNGCIDRSINLWAEIERLSNRKVFMRDLPERINTTNDNEQVIKVLRKGRM